MVEVTETERLPRRERERIARLQEILIAAKKIFARDGYDSTNLENVAELCELSKGTIYYYFKSKAELFNRILESGIDEITANIEKATLIENVRDSIYHVIYSTLEKFRMDLDLVKILFFARKRIDRELYKIDADPLQDKFKNAVDKLAKIFQRGIDNGEVKQFDPSMLAYILIGMMHTFALKLKTDPKTGADILSEIIFEGIKIRKTI